MAKPTKGSLHVKTPVDPALLEAALNPEAPTAQAADLADVTGGVVGATIQEEVLHERAAPLREAEAEAADTFSDKVGAAVDESYTAYILEAFDRSEAAQYSVYDPAFDATRRAGDLLKTMGIPVTDEHLRILARAGNAEDQVDLANRLRQHQLNQEVLSRHGGYALASGALDPATLLTDFATFGYSKSVQLGRLATAATVGGGALGITAAADAAGRESEAFEYLLNASLAAGFGALFGGRGIGGGGVSGPASGNSFLSGNGSVANVNRKLQGFLSETDKLAATPESEALLRNLVDDPVRRDGLLTNDNAASIYRKNMNEMDGHIKEYDELVEQALSSRFSWTKRKVDISGEYTAAKDALNEQVARELLRRDEQWSRYGNVTADANVDPLIARLADKSDELHGRMGEIAREAGVRGFEDFTRRPGYFHRSWNESHFRRIEAESPGAVRRLLTESAYMGIKGIDREEADAIAGALIQRVKDKASGMRSEFMGALGKADTAFLRESLEAAKVSQGRIDSIMAKVEQKASDQGTIKYGKHRLSLDMGVAVRTPNGEYRMSDLIDMDLDRVMENYTSSLSGRAALAKAGIGGDDAALEAFKRDYLKSIQALPREAQDSRMLQLDGLLGDFTGNRPAENVLGPLAQRLKSLADATMLSASGLWQVGEYATIAARQGFIQTGKEFMRAFPGVRQVLQHAKTNPDLADELSTVLHLDLARDVRFRPWKRQHDAFLAASDTMLDRVLHAGKQAVPYLNMMKFVHQHQARMNANLVLNKFARAAKGDTRALAEIKKYAPDLDWPRAEAALRANVTYNSGGKNASSMGFDGWPQDVLDSTMNAALRMMDDALLFGRPGQGASFSRSQVGQVMGQFRSFVSFAHNKLLRGTFETSGPMGLAALLAFQYPLIFLMVGVNEARRGELDLTEEGLTKAAKKALGYTAGLGFIADGAGVVGLTGGRGGLSVPITGLFDAPGRFVRGVRKLADDEATAGEAFYDMGKAAAAVAPFINAAPATAIALDAMKGE